MDATKETQDNLTNEMPKIQLKHKKIQEILKIGEKNENNFFLKKTT